uniref:DUF834 domain-containing protein n=1 Tax=Oryza nivara TaxID=4536 RepID=A0A0E0HUG2_ORYNI
MEEMAMAIAVGLGRGQWLGEESEGGRAAGTSDGEEWRRRFGEEEDAQRGGAAVRRSAAVGHLTSFVSRVAAPRGGGSGDAAAVSSHDTSRAGEISSTRWRMRRGGKEQGPRRRRAGRSRGGDGVGREGGASVKKT